MYINKLGHILSIVYHSPTIYNPVLRGLNLLGSFSLGWYDLNLEGDEELQKSLCVLQVQRIFLSDLPRRPCLRLTLVAARGLQSLSDGQLAFRNICELHHAVRVPG